MQRLRNKITGEGGVSILYAMLFMMVGFMVSAVILAASTSSLSRMHDDKVWRQDRLTLNSAGELLRELLDQTSYTVTLDEYGAVASVTGEGPLAGIFEDAVEETAGLTRDIPLTDGHTSERKFTVDAAGYGKVWVTYVMYALQPDVANGGYTNPDDRCRIEAILQLSDSPSIDDQRLFLHAYDISGGDEPDGNTFTVQWKKGEAEEGGSGAVNEGITLSTREYREGA